MYIHTVRQIINSRNEEFQAELQRRTESGKTITQVCAEDPFFAGRGFELGQLLIKLVAAELDEEHERQLRSYRR